MGEYGDKRLGAPGWLMWSRRLGTKGGCGVGMSKGNGEEWLIKGYIWSGGVVEWWIGVGECLIG